jgi:hypothetical protein
MSRVGSETGVGANWTGSWTPAAWLLVIRTLLVQCHLLHHRETGVPNGASEDGRYYTYGSSSLEYVSEANQEIRVPRFGSRCAAQGDVDVAPPWSARLFALGTPLKFSTTTGGRRIRRFRRRSIC